MKPLRSEAELTALRKKALPLVVPTIPTIAVGLGTCGIGNGAQDVFDAIRVKLEAAGIDVSTEGGVRAVMENGKAKAVRLKRTGCFGYCAEEPLVSIYLPGLPALLFGAAKAKDAASFVRAALDPAALAKLAPKAFARIDEWDFVDSRIRFASPEAASTEPWASVPRWDETSFFKGQKKIVLRDAGLIDPENIDEYIAVGGYASLLKALTAFSPDKVVAEVSASGLRGRGGAGFPTGRKWELMRLRQAEEKWVICNADEGDPGAYMNRNEIESDPHMLIEGMAIGAYAMGAKRGFVYVRAEYPLAVARLTLAIVRAREYGFLGDRIFGSDFSFDLELVQGAGAFVCGEETALIASAEGRAGRASPRPPFPAQSGYRGAPTTINNVETWTNVPWIIARGAEAFKAVGTVRSSGTKVFSLVGKARNTGLVELPLGAPLDSIVYGMGGGAGKHKRVRAVQTGGPSGGCVSADKLGVAVDYESLAELGAIMGSGGMVVLDGDNCMVDTARYFTAFTAAESCGKCAPCREGLAQMLHILDEVSRGTAKESDLDELEALARMIKDSALCGLGQTAANPVLSTLKYFRDEYLAHIREKRCEAGVCDTLYSALCENSCPMHLNIPGYLELLKEGRIEEAYELTLRGNPLPGTLGRICHFHCQMRCRRDTIDDPVAQGEIHRYLADAVHKLGRAKTVWARIAAEKLPATGKIIAIVGAGPAGLAAAYFLARLGHEVTVYDAHAKAGGVLRYGIPAYRLPHEVLDGELGLFTKLGVKFELGKKVGKDVAFEELRSSTDAVLIAVGASADKPLGIPGEYLPGVLAGYEFLEAFGEKRVKAPTGRVVIIGGGNVAIDAARTLLRTGAQVTVAYRRTRDDLPANDAEIKGAEDEGINFVYFASPEEILAGKDGKIRAVRFARMVAGPIDRSGRPTPVPSGERFEIPCDAVVSAVGEKVDPFALGEAVFAMDKGGTIAADRFNCLTSLNGVWAAGDAVSGPATAAEAMGRAIRAVKSIDFALMGEWRFHMLDKDFDYRMAAPLEPSAVRMHRSRRLSPEDRRNNFHEIASGYTGEQALAEAERCLRCDIKTCAH